jgi:hypothetical protein
MSKFKEPFVVSYTCAGPTYRKSTYDKIKNYYFDDDNVYYCILTDDKTYFSDLKRKNLIVNELKDFYNEFPNLEQNEFFIDSINENDYAEKFLNTNYKFPFSVYRFNILQAIKLNIKNVSLMCTDTKLDFDFIDDEFFNTKNIVHAWGGVTEQNVNHNKTINYMNMITISNFLKNKYNLPVDEVVGIQDEVGRFMLFDDMSNMKKFFNIWNDVVNYLYESNKIMNYRGGHVIHDEFIMGVIYNALKITQGDGSVNYFQVRHNPHVERFWYI